MAIGSDLTTDEYRQSVEYIRRLCEGEEGHTTEGKASEALALANGFIGLGEALESSNGSSRLPADLTLSVAGGFKPLGGLSKSQLLACAPPVKRNSRAVTCVNTSASASASAATRSTSCAGRRTSANGSGKNGQTPADDGTHDMCDACGQPGEFICCEMCPRVFHFLCVNPPMTPEAVRQLDHWYCRQCAHLVSRKRKSRAHAKNIFYPLLSGMEFENPRVFAVPEDIRRQFDGIEADIDGTFINTRKDKPVRVKDGAAGGRDFARLVDDQGETIMCYRCGLSALHGPVVRCDYCPLSWHWDCLSPPLSAAPPPRRRWMCPNHADHALGRHQHHKFRKERIVDLAACPDDKRNGAIVDVVDDDPPCAEEELFDPKVKYRIRSSRIRREFSKNARPCRIAPAQSIVPRDDPNPDSVTDWLQAIVALQQDVARFVMSTAERSVLQRACKGMVADRREEEPEGESKFAILACIAGQMLTPLMGPGEGTGREAVSPGVPLDSTACGTSDAMDLELQTATTVDMDSAPQAVTTVDMDSAPQAVTTVDTDSAPQVVTTGMPDRLTACVSKSNAAAGLSPEGPQQTHRRRRRLLEDHRLTDSDLEAAVRRIFEGMAEREKNAPNDTRINGLANGSGNSGSRGSKRKRRSSSLGDISSVGPTPSSPRMVSLDAPVKKLRRSVEPVAEPASFLQCSAVDSGGDPEMGSAGVRADRLVGSLLRAKGSDALLDFLMS